MKATAKLATHLRASWRQLRASLTRLTSRVRDELDARVRKVRGR